MTEADRPKSARRPKAPSRKAPGPAPAETPAAASGKGHTEITVSRSFAGWLRSNRVSLAFTSYQTGQLFMVGLSPNGAVSFHQENFRRAMGLCLNGDHIYLASFYQVWRLENALLAGETANGHFDRLFVPRTAQTIGDVDMHEIAVDRGGRPIFVSTAFSCLATASRRRGFAPIWKPPFISRLAPEDRCHLNGLAMEDGAPRYVTAVSRSDILTGWRDRRQAGGIIVDVQSDAILTDQLSMPHSPRVHAGQLWALDSGRGCLIRVNRQTGEREDIAFCPGFLRGLAFVGDYAIVTVSLPRSQIAFRDLELGERLTAGDGEPRCGIMVIDTNRGDIVEWIRLDGAITELFDVIALPDIVCPMSVGPDSQAMHSVITFEPAFAPLNLS